MSPQAWAIIAGRKLLRNCARIQSAAISHRSQNPAVIDIIT
jgi:hypothetical protein